MKKHILMIALCFLICGCTIQKTTDPEYKTPLTMYQCAREHLSDVDKVVYDQLIHVYLKQDTELALNDMNNERLEPIIQAVLDDHPEIFYLDTQYTYETSDRDAGRFVYRPQYRYTAEEILKTQTIIRDVSQPLIEEAKTMSSDYDKVKFIYDYIIDTCVYDETSKENQNIQSVFLYQRSVCAGYAKSMQYLLQQLDIPCAYLSGYPRYQSAQAHAWNMVYMDDSYYYLDATNGDPKEEALSPEYRYLYFGLTRSQMMRLYEPDNEAYVEAASSLENNYFYRKQAYFQNADITQLQTLIDTNLNTMEPFSLTLLASDNAVGRELNEYVQTNHYLFDTSGYQNFQYYEIPELNAYVYQPYAQ